ncbi:MAG TPA: cytochrome P450 [Rhodopila sp.]|nr:cytochrome P450 [Rhodopila sp.]
MSETAAFAFDPRNPAFLANPYAMFHQLRAAAPVWKAPVGRWFLTRYDDCALVVRDRRFGKDYDNPDALKRRFGPTALEEPAVRELTHMMLLRDPPDHTRLRGLATKAFTARRIEALRGWVQDLTDQLLDKVASDGRMDAVRDLAFPLPVLVICELLGIPEQDRAAFISGSTTGAPLLEPTVPSREVLDAANIGTEESKAYFEPIFQARRHEPRDDLITQLVQAEEQGDRLTSDELHANVRLLFGAGHETTVNLIGNGLLALLRNPDQWQILRDDPALVPNAVEELLRYDSPVQAIARVTTEPVELSGVAMDKGEMLVALLGAGNHDPAVFENPDQLDVTRKELKPLSFGGGIHFCLGAQLARIEAAVVLETLLRRLPNLRLAEPERADWRPSFVLRGLTSLPVVWN